MNLTLKASHLRLGLQHAIRAIPKRPSKPIYRNIRLDVMRDGWPLTITAGDEAMGLCIRLPGNMPTAEPGSILLDGKPTETILKSIKGDEITIEDEPSKDPDPPKIRVGAAGFLNISRSDFVINASVDDPTKYPEPCEYDHDSGLLMPIETLRRAIVGTIRATDPENTRYALGSVLLCPAANNSPDVRFVATDGRRLHFLDVPSNEVNALPNEGQTLIPASMLKFLLSMMSQFLPDDARLSFNGGLAIMTFKAPAIGGDVALWTRLGEGRFPKYQDVFESCDHNTFLDVDRKEFARFIELASITTSEESAGVILEMGYDRVAAWSRAADVGKCEVDLPIGTFTLEGNPRIVMLDPRYVREALDSLPPGEDRIRIAFGDDRVAQGRDSAMEIRFEEFTGYIMPMIREEELIKPKWLDEWAGLPAPVATPPVVAEPEPELDPSVDRDIYKLLTTVSATEIGFIQRLNDADLPTLRAALAGNQERKGRQGACKLIDKRIKSLTGKGKAKINHAEA